MAGRETPGGRFSANFLTCPETFAADPMRCSQLFLPLPPLSYGTTLIPCPALPCDNEYMATRQEVMARLRGLKGELADRYDVLEIGIFGSVARGENDTASDIDLLVEFGPRADLITYIGLWQFLEESFGAKIDLVSKGGLRSELRDSVMRDVVYV